MRLGQPGPVGEVTRVRGTVDAEETVDRLARRGRAARPALRVPAGGVEPRARLDGREAPQHRSDVVAPAALAPRHQVRANAPAELLVQGVLVERAIRERLLDRRRDLVEGVAERKPLLGREPLDLLAELRTELLVVTSKQGRPHSAWSPGASAWIAPRMTCATTTPPTSTAPSYARA